MTEWPTRTSAFDGSVIPGHSDVVKDTERPCVHEWRLIDERSSTYNASPGAYITVRRWYCVHCRTVEETTA